MTMVTMTNVIMMNGRNMLLLPPIMMMITSLSGGVRPGSVRRLNVPLMGKTCHVACKRRLRD
jgi:hypothetical protein